MPVTIYEAMLTGYGKILYLGTKDEVIKIAKAIDAQIVDLNDATILPPFLDTHLHLDELSLRLCMLDLTDVKRIDELKGKLRDFAVSNKDIPFILGYGWDHENLKEGRYPNIDDIEAVVSDKPVILLRKCLHVGVMNKRARIITELGDGDGVVKEADLFEARNRLLNFFSGDEFLLKATENSMAYLFDLGLSAVCFVSCRASYLKLLFGLDKDGKVPIDILTFIAPKKELLEYIKAFGIKGGFGSNRVKIKGLKIFIDGALGTKTALLSEPYSDGGGYGIKVINDVYFKEVLDFAFLNDMEVAIHAIGDASIDFVISNVEHLGQKYFDIIRIEHASVLRDDQVESIKRYNIRLSLQPRFLISDWWVVKRLGEKRAKWVYRLKSLSKFGIDMGFGTDAPVEPVNPWLGIYSAVTRGSYEDKNYLYRLTPNETLSLEEALYYYTFGSASILGMLDDYGDLTPGKRADFLILKEDPFGVDLQRIKDVVVDKHLTY